MLPRDHLGRFTNYKLLLFRIQIDHNCLSQQPQFQSLVWSPLHLLHSLKKKSFADDFLDEIAVNYLILDDIRSSHFKISCPVDLSSRRDR